MLLNWSKAYERCWGRKIEAVLWMPIQADTPTVVGDLQKSSLTFSGAAVVAYEGGGDLFYTWTQGEPDRYLDLSDEASSWKPFSLDRIAASPEDPWSAVWGAEIVRIDLFADVERDGQERTVGARHTLKSQHGETTMWIGTGGHGRIYEMDDLWVSVGVDPQNLPDLVLTSTYEPRG